jgi:hypothetical protein
MERSTKFISLSLSLRIARARKQECQEIIPMTEIMEPQWFECPVAQIEGIPGIFTGIFVLHRGEALLTWDDTLRLHSYLSKLIAEVVQ